MSSGGGVSSSQNRSEWGPSCVLCEMNHAIKLCRRFLSLCPERRFAVLNGSGYCLNCLARSHITIGCKARYLCSICNGRHNTLIHGAPQLQNHSETTDRKVALEILRKISLINSVRDQANKSPPNQPTTVIDVDQYPFHESPPRCSKTLKNHQHYRASKTPSKRSAAIDYDGQYRTNKSPINHTSHESPPRCSKTLKNDQQYQAQKTPSKRSAAVKYDDQHRTNKSPINHPSHESPPNCSKTLRNEQQYQATKTPSKRSAAVKHDGQYHKNKNPINHPTRVTNDTTYPSLKRHKTSPTSTQTGESKKKKVENNIPCKKQITVTSPPFNWSKVFVPTAQIRIALNDEPGVWHLCRVGINKLSTHSRIAASLTQDLQLNTFDYHGVKFARVQATSRLSRFKWGKEICALVTNELPRRLYEKPLNKDPTSEFNEDTLADADPMANTPIEMELGADQYCTLWRNGVQKTRLDFVVAEQTAIGYTFTGPIDENGGLFKDTDLM